MFEERPLSNFYIKLCDIANEFFTLGEKVLESVLMRKIITSLLDRFQSKTSAIEESKNLDTMKVEELMGSLCAFEMNLKPRKQEKSIIFKSTQEKAKTWSLIGTVAGDLFTIFFYINTNLFQS